MRADEWVEKPGIPDNAPVFRSPKLEALTALAGGWASGKRPDPDAAASAEHRIRELRAHAAAARRRAADARAQVLARRAAGDDASLLEELERGFDLLARENDQLADELQRQPGGRT